MFAALLMLQPAPTWAHYGGDSGRTRFAAQSQITKENVADLGLAWTYRTEDGVNQPGEGPSTNFECTPILAHNRLYLSTPRSRIIALDPETGQQIWKFDPKIDFRNASTPLVSRGVSVWNDRIFFATYDARLVALNASNGNPIPGFGSKGFVDLKSGLGKTDPGEYTITSPPAIAGDLVIVGSCISDNVRANSPSGAVRAFDALTGELRWSWHPLGRTTNGSANAWSIMSVDEERGMIFVPTGSQSPDFYGGTRPGDNAAANSVTALDAKTGRQLWSFQVVHHDVWDYDVPAQPILADVKNQPAVIVLTKMGHIFVLDRLTGKPIYPVEERPVPQGGVAGEQLAKTQPFPILPKPLLPSQVTEEDVWGINDREREFVLNKLKGRRNEGIFTPPSLEGTVNFPGTLGGANWSGGSFDPQRQLLFVNTNRLATIATLIPRAQVAKALQDNPSAIISPQSGTPYAVKIDWLFAHNRVPGTKPPWGLLSAIDLRTGELKWESPLGQTMALRGDPKSEQYGSINLGGSFATSTGLVFIAAGQDARLSAYDSDSGEVLWKMRLPAGGNAAPMTYIGPKSGRQFIVQCAGGHGGLGSPMGDSVCAYALPK